MTPTMRAWIVDSPGPAAAGPLALVTRPVPEPAGREVLVRVQVCGVCRTDLHLAEGDLPPRRHGVVPGHEVVGRVEATGPHARDLGVGDRIGIPWLRRTCGRCRWCTTGRENLCTEPAFTGWDADGGFADLAVVDERFAHRIPPSLSDHDAAPLLCAGIIGYRALRRSRLPEGGRLGIYGFGASAHLTAQVALHEGATVHVLTRSEAARALALRLGCASAGPADGRPPEPLDAAILFAPVGELVPVALRALDRGATLAIAGIHLSDIPVLDYATHLFQERSVTSVTANTRADGAELLALAERIPLRPTVVRYPFEAVDRALVDLAADRVDGVAVVDVAPGATADASGPPA
jgi:propanol-preferring alcohol dehydrogenase